MLEKREKAVGHLLAMPTCEQISPGTVRRNVHLWQICTNQARLNEFGPDLLSRTLPRRGPQSKACGFLAA
eukprot:6183989-Pleurochrysis_carterae.AAC.1